MEIRETTPICELNGQCCVCGCHLAMGCLVSDFEIPPPSKIARTVEDEGVEQLQPTLDSTTAGEAQEDVLWCTSTCAAVP